MVAKQSDKTAIILKYEIGFSRYLILGGYHLATFVDGILPYHPVYRDTAFTVMRDGFPLLKRQFLYENPFSQPDLVRWKERVLEAVPGGRRRGDGAQPAARRSGVEPAPQLRDPHGPRRPRRACRRRSSPDEFADEEAWTPKHDHWWAFPVDPVSHRLEGNARAVFEAVADDPSIRKLVLTASVEQKVAGANVVSRPDRERARPVLPAARGHHLRDRRSALRRQPPAVGPAAPLRRAAPRHPSRRVRRGRAVPRHRGRTRAPSAGQARQRPHRDRRHLVRGRPGGHGSAVRRGAAGLLVGHRRAAHRLPAGRRRRAARRPAPAGRLRGRAPRRPPAGAVAPRRAARRGG